MLKSSRSSIVDSDNISDRGDGLAEGDDQLTQDPDKRERRHSVVAAEST